MKNRLKKVISSQESYLFILSRSVLFRVQYLEFINLSDSQMTRYSKMVILIKRYLDSNLEEKIRSIVRDRSKMSFLSKRDLLKLTNYMYRRFTFSPSLIKYVCKKIGLVFEPGDQPLFLACDTGDLEKVKLLLSDKMRRLCYGIDPAADFNEPICTACRNGHLEIVKFLLSDEIIAEYPEIDPAARNNEPLIYASNKGHLDVVKFLLSEKIRTTFPRINPADCSSRALRYACEDGHIEVVKFLLSDEIRRLYPEIKPYALHNQSIVLTIANGHTHIIKFLLSYEMRTLYPEIDPCADGNNGLMCAIRYGSIEIVKFLLSDTIKKAYPKIETVNCRKSISGACKKGKIDVIKFLLSDETLSANPLIEKDIYFYYSNFLNTVCKKNKIDLVRFFFYDVEFDTRFTKLASSIRCHTKPTDVVSVTYSPDFINYLIILVCKKGHIDVLKFFLSPEIDEMYKGYIDPGFRYNSALRAACSARYIEIIKFLLSDVILAKYRSIDPGIVPDDIKFFIK